MMYKVCKVLMIALLLLAGGSGLAAAAANADMPSSPTVILYEGMAREDKPLRLHVLANSDSSFDQQIKLEVRDVAVHYLEEVLVEAENKEEALQKVQENLPQIEQLCNGFLSSAVDYTAKAAVEIADFPAINYNGTVYAAGEYDALRIILGEGAGKNWWCVLFPPMCFVDLAAEVDEEALLAVMAGEEAAAGYRIGWKWLDLLLGSE